MKTVIMAGGKGTRISTLFPDIPKPLIPIIDRNEVEKPVLEWEIEELRDQGFREIIVTVSHMADKIQNYFGDGKRLGVKLEYFVEDTPLGNAGALFRLRDNLTDDFLLLNGDTVFDVDFNRMVERHRSTGALVTLFTHPNSHPYDSGLIIADENGVVEHWLTKEEVRPKYYKNRVNAGLHVISPVILDLFCADAECIGKEGPDGKVFKVDLDRMLLNPLCKTGRMYCYDSPEYVKDMGTPERYQQVSRDFKNGTVTAKNLKNRQRAIFLDRDGTINKYVGFLRKPEELELIDGVAEAIKLINCSGYLAIVITNQPVVARGEISIPQLNYIHEKLETLLGQEGAYFDGLYYCPHHPHSGYEGEIKELKIECDCRKPKPGLILRAAEDFNIELSRSWMIGDGENDVLAGKAAGCRTIKIGGDCGADYIAPDLVAAVNMILDK